MSEIQQLERIRELIALGKERGFLFDDEINTAFPGMVDADQWEAITLTFREIGFQIVSRAEKRDA